MPEAAGSKPVPASASDESEVGGLTADSGTARVTVPRQADEAPSWAVPYGKEFWRRPVAPVTSGAAARAAEPMASQLNLSDVIDRVSHAFTEGTEGEAPRVKAKTFSAGLDREALQFSPHRTSLEADPEAALRFRTLAVRSGDRPLFQAGNRVEPWSVVGNTAQRLLEASVGLIEHYEVRGEGLEVTWLLQQRPAGEEGLEIEAELTGLSYAGETRQGHHFADADGISRVRLGAVTVVDAHGARTEVATEFRNGTWRVLITPAMLATFAFPLAIDPLLSPEFGMDEPVLSFSIETAVDPAIASNGNEYLAVWADSRKPGQSSVFGTRVNREGVVLDPRGRLIATYSGGVLYPAVASNGRDYLVAWRGGYTGGTVLGTRVTSAGVPLDTNILLQIGYSSAHPRPSIASDGTNYFVVWEHPIESPYDGEDILGARVSHDGKVLDSPSLVIKEGPGRQRGPAVAWNGSIYLVVWNDQQEVPYSNQILAGRVTGEGIVLDPEGFVTEGTAAGTFPTPAVASNGREFLVVGDGVATRVSAEGTLLGVVSLDGNGIPGVAYNGRDYLVVQLQGLAIHAVLVSGGGAVLASADLATGGNYFDWSRPAVASAGGSFFAVWDDRRLSNGRIFGAHITAEGAAARRDIPVSTDFNAQLGPAVASNGQDYLVVWNDYRFGTFRDIFGVRLAGDGTVLDLSALPIRRGPGLEEAAGVASNGRDYFVVWQEYRGGNAWYLYGGRVTREGAVLDPEGVGIRTSGPGALVPRVASNGRNYLVAWAEYSGNRDTFNDIRGARVSENAAVLDPASFLISNRPNHEYAAAVASDGTDYLVTWHGWATEAHPIDEVFAARVAESGAVIDPDGFALTASTNFCTFPAVAFNGSDYLVAWSEVKGYANADIHGARVTTAGVVLDAPALAINSQLGTQLYPAVTSDGSDFLVAWSDLLIGRAEVRAARVAAAGHTIESNGIFIADSHLPYSTTVALAHNGSRYLAVYTVSEDGQVYRTRGRFIEFTLPPPWQDADVGNPGVAGGAGFSNDIFTVNASGTNIWGRSDAFHFVFQTLHGDGQIIARLASLEEGHPRAKAGVMLRDGLSTAAKNVFLGVTADQHLVFQTRVNDGGRTFQIGRNSSIPLWVRLVRRGNTIIGYQSTDGVRWRFVWFAWANLPAALEAGLAVTARNDSDLITATFDNVSVAPRETAAGVVSQSGDLPAPEVSVAASSGAQAGFTLHIAGIAGRYVIEASDDLLNWTTLGVATNTDGAVEFVDPDAANHSRRFYRVRLEAP